MVARAGGVALGEIQRLRLSPPPPHPLAYLWGATTVQQRGKYTADRRWDATLMDPQIGGMALLAALMTREPEIRSQMGDSGEVAAHR